MDELSKAVLRSNDPGSAPDWLIPQTTESIGFCLADSVRRVSGLATAVIVRDPATDIASVVATSAGAERRLVGWVVPPACAAGRACVSDVVSFGNGPEELLGCNDGQHRYVDQGVAFSLIDGRRSVGALVVFASPDFITGDTNDRLRLLAREAGGVIGRALAARTAEQRGLIDEVTGQLNRAGLEHAIRDSFHEPCAVVCADLDQFPQLDPGLVNVVLKQIANTLRKAVRSYDLTARIEEDEFALFLPATPMDDAIKVAHRICMAVGESEIDLAPNDVFTCSLGVASIPDTVSDMTDLMAAAAEAAKKAQDRGHNCVVAAQPR